MPNLPQPINAGGKLPLVICFARRNQQTPSLASIHRRVTDAALWVKCRYQLGRKVLLQAQKQDKANKATVSLKRSRPMSESEPGLVRDIMLKVNMHFDMLMRGAVPDDDKETHDYLCHCVGISQIRIMDIGMANKSNGGIATANELMLTLNAAAQGLLRARQRHGKTGRWGLDGPALEALRGAIEIYEEVLRASSAMQMEHAQGARLHKLQRQQAELEGVAA